MKKNKAISAILSICILGGVFSGITVNADSTDNTIDDSSTAVTYENFENYNLTAVLNSDKELTLESDGADETDTTKVIYKGRIINAPGGNIYKEKNEIYEGNAAENIVTYAKLDDNTVRWVKGGLNNGWTGVYSHPALGADKKANAGANGFHTPANNLLGVTKDGENQLLRLNPATNGYVSPQSTYAYSGLDLTNKVVWESNVKVENVSTSGDALGEFTMGIGTGTMNTVAPFTNVNFPGNGISNTMALISFTNTEISVNGAKLLDCEQNKYYNIAISFNPENNTFKAVIKDLESDSILATSADISYSKGFTNQMSVYYTAKTGKNATETTCAYIDNLKITSKEVINRAAVNKENFESYSLEIKNSSKTYSIEGYEGVVPAWRILNAPGTTYYDVVYEGNAAENIITYARLDADTVKVVPGGLNNGWYGTYSHPAKDPAEKNGGAGGIHIERSNRLGVVKDGENKVLKFNPRTNSYITTRSDYAYQNLDLTKPIIWESDIKLENINNLFVMGASKGELQTANIFEDYDVFQKGRTGETEIIYFDENLKGYVNGTEFMQFEKNKYYSIMVIFAAEQQSYMVIVKNPETGAVIKESDLITYEDGFSDNMQIFYYAETAKGAASETTAYVDNIVIDSESIRPLSYSAKGSTLSVDIDAVNTNPMNFETVNMIMAVYEKATNKLVSCSKMKEWNAVENMELKTALIAENVPNYSADNYTVKIMAWDSNLKPLAGNAEF